MSIPTADILTSWEQAKVPNTNNLTLINYPKSNLWILKTHDKRFGFLIVGTLGQIKDNYKNLEIKWIPNLYDNSGKKLENCLVITGAKNIDSYLFCSAINSLFKTVKDEKVFSVKEIKAALNEIDKITRKEIDELNEVIGAWGELYLLKEMIICTKDDINKYELLSSWEGVDDRTKIDFNISSKKIKIEVKTTTSENRLHYFNGLGQVIKGKDWDGYLASFCIAVDESGHTCFNLIRLLRANLNPDALSLLEEKLKIRGKVCMNNEIRIIINTDKNLELFDFKNVPKPSIEPGVGRIEWEADLENQSHLSETEKMKIIRMFS